MSPRLASALVSSRGGKRSRRGCTLSPTDLVSLLCQRQLARTHAKRIGGVYLRASPRSGERCLAHRTRPCDLLRAASAGGSLRPAWTSPSITSLLCCMERGCSGRLTRRDTYARRTLRLGANGGALLQHGH